MSLKSIESPTNAVEKPAKAKKTLAERLAEIDTGAELTHSKSESEWKIEHLQRCLERAKKEIEEQREAKLAERGKSKQFRAEREEIRKELIQLRSKEESNSKKINALLEENKALRAALDSRNHMLSMYKRLSAAEKVVEGIRIEIEAFEDDSE